MSRNAWLAMFLLIFIASIVTFLALIWWQGIFLFIGFLSFYGMVAFAKAEDNNDVKPKK